MNRGAALGLFLAALLLMQGLQLYGAAYAADGVHFQQHSSEDMMQTVSLADLRHHPWQTLLALHIQPPLLDGLRALLARLWPELRNKALVLAVDRALYFLWTLAYAAMGVLVFRWLERLLGSTRVALAAAAAFLLHPAALYYGTYLDGTFLTSLGVLWLCYSLWAMPGRGTTLSMGAAYLFLFLLRSIFQWPALVVLLAALLLRRAPRRRVLAFAACCGVVVAGLMLKQYLVFGSTSTSSFAGSSCLKALGELPEMGKVGSEAVALGPLLRSRAWAEYPLALTRESKVTGAHNYNHLADLANERRLLGECVERMRSDPLSRTLRAWLTNLSVFLEPSSQYLTTHAIVDHLPWRGLYDWVFSGSRLLLLLAAAAVVWARGRRGRAELARGLGLALPVGFVIAACVAFERDENMRYKFFVEPVLYVFIASQLLAPLLARAAAHAHGEHRWSTNR